MQAVGPIDVLSLFPNERAALLDLLNDLQPEEWALPTVCEGWSVKDIAAHILADDLGRLSRDRDGHKESYIETDSWPELLAAINAANEAWVASMRRISPQLLVELLAFSGTRLTAHVEALDMTAMGQPVSWAGPDPAPVWFDIAREYTEYWAHQQQIRDAVARPGLKDRGMFAPVLDCYVRALPQTYRDTLAPEGTHVRLRVSGEGGGIWHLVREAGRWALFLNIETEPDASISLDDDTAWRTFTRSITPASARTRAVLTGDIALAAKALDTVAILA
jgi:uncharacterized protein (TIGR03083 family)